MNVCARAAGHGRCSLSTLKEVVKFSESLNPPVESTVISYTSMLDALAKAHILKSSLYQSLYCTLYHYIILLCHSL